MSVFGPQTLGGSAMITDKVLCPHVDLGCKWQGHPLQIQDHLRQCVFERLEVNKTEINELRSQVAALTKGLASLMSENKMVHVALASHTDVVVSLANYDRLMFSGSMDGTLKVWDLNVLQLKREVSLGPVYSLRVGGSRLYSGHQGNIKVWDLSSFTLIATLMGHVGNVKALLIQGNRLFSGSTGEVKVWDVNTLNCLTTLQNAHKGEIRAFICTLDGTGSMHYLWSGGDDGHVKLWNRNFECAHDLCAHAGPVRAMVAAALSHGSFLVTGSDDTYLKIWNASDLSLVATLPCFAAVGSLAFVRPHSLLSGHADGLIRVWNMSNPVAPRAEKLLVSHNDAVRTLMTLPDCFVSGSYDRSIKVWYPNK